MADQPNKTQKVKSSVSKSTLEKRAPRDVERTPSVKEIEESIQKGTSRPLADFQRELGWK